MFWLRISRNHKLRARSGRVCNELVDIVGNKAQDERLSSGLLHIEKLGQREIPRTGRIRLEVQLTNGPPCNLSVCARFFDKAAYRSIKCSYLIEVFYDQFGKAYRITLEVAWQN